MDPLMAITDFLWLFQLTLQQWQDLQHYHVSPYGQPYIIKLMGVLYRGQQAYLRRPFVFKVYRKRPGETEDMFIEPLQWCIAAWMKIRNHMDWPHIRKTYQLRVFSDDIILSVAPWCWRCMKATARVCHTCEVTCKYYGLRSIPTCEECSQCQACRKDIFREGFIQNRFSFHLADEMARINQALNQVAERVD